MTHPGELTPSNNPETHPGERIIFLPPGVITDNSFRSEGVQTNEERFGVSADLQVNTTSPLEYVPAKAAPYLEAAKRGLRIPESAQGEAEAVAYAKKIFPNKTFDHIGSGRHGVVLGDETGKAFKVYRSTLRYSRYEREAGALKLLSDAGLAPTLHIFVDAHTDYRLDAKAYDYTNGGFENVQIPRQDSGRELPILVMDKVDSEPLENADPIELANGFCKAAELFIKEGIHTWDSEVVVDRHSGKVLFLDVGELSQVPFDAAHATQKEIENYKFTILRNLILDFGLTNHTYKIQSIYKTEGLEGVHALLAASGNI